MRKLIVSMNVTVDGFVSGSNCELDWHFQSWNEEMAKSFCEQLSTADTILLGRITYKAMAGYWPFKPTDPSYPREDIAFADMMNNYCKIVFSRTMTVAEWHNSKLVKGNIAKKVTSLKKEPGKDIITYGSSKIVSELMKYSLVDEYQIWVHPVILGNGKPLFKNLHERINMKLFQTKIFGSGVVVLYYKTN